MNQYKLAILICTIPERDDFLRRLNTTLHRQLSKGVGMFTDERVGISIGEKRNSLLATGVNRADYVAFIDDDDIVSEDYVSLLMEGINRGVDCCSLRGVITEDGFNPRLFEHSIKYRAYRTVEEHGITRYERYPNHLNCIKSEIAGQFKFPEKNHGEDTDWATQIHKSGLLKTEHWIEDIIYYYEYRSKK